MGVMSFSFCCFFGFPCVYCVHRGTLRFLMIFAVYLSQKLKKKEGREGGVTMMGVCQTKLAIQMGGRSTMLVMEG